MKVNKLIVLILTGIVISYATGCKSGIEQEPSRESLAEMISEASGLCREFMEVLFRAETQPPRRLFTHESLTAAILLAAAPLKELEPKFEGPPPAGGLARMISSKVPPETSYLSISG